MTVQMVYQRIKPDVCHHFTFQWDSSAVCRANWHFSCLLLTGSSIQLQFSACSGRITLTLSLWWANKIERAADKWVLLWPVIRIFYDTVKCGRSGAAESANKRRICGLHRVLLCERADSKLCLKRCGILLNKLETRAVKEMIMRSLNGGGPCGAQSFDANAMKRG